jgi:hypothetical protein
VLNVAQTAIRGTFRGIVDSMTDPAADRPRPIHYNYATRSAVPPKKRSIGRRLGLAAILISLIGLAGGVAAVVTLWQIGRTPREWAAELLRPAFNEQPALGRAARFAAHWLTRADRLAPAGGVVLPGSLGASPDRSGDVPNGRLRLVASLEALSDAAAAAEPGDVIQLQPGRYHVSGKPIHFSATGTAAKPITVRAARLGDVVIESDAAETLKVTGPFWRFENLSLRGVCADHTQCEHAIHVVAGANGTVIRNNLLADFNAHIKINAEDGLFPDGGLVDGNTLLDTAPRSTVNPITPVDLVSASDWVIRGNLIADFMRAPGYGGQTSYGAFVKGEGKGNIIERNVVVCEWKLRDIPAQTVGLSLGGGGTGIDFRREGGTSGFEQIGGVIRDNLVAFCSDDGIYVNRSARSVIDHNTLLDTAGIDVRFVESSARVTRNIVDGVIRERDGGTLRAADNDTAFLPGLFAGLHPQRGLYRDPATLDLAWRTAPASVAETEPGADLCGHRRGGEALPGAFEDYADCLAGQ